MKVYKLIIVILLMVVYLGGHTQSRGSSIRGTILDRNKNLIVAASISLFASRDTTVIATLLSDSNGKFLFNNLSSGTYVLNITSIGYNPYTSPKIHLPSADTIIYLSPVLEDHRVKVLNEAIVTGKKPLFEQQPDRIIMNVEAIISNIGSILHKG